MNAHSVSGRRRAARAGLIVVALALPLAGCKEIKESSAEGYHPSKVEAVGGLAVKQVTLTAEAAEKIDLHTAPAVSSGRYTVVDYEALIYDGKGQSWVYTALTPLTFLRTSIVIDQIVGQQVMLSGGLAPGTGVVTVGAAEVYGAELNIAGSH